MDSMKDKDKQKLKGSESRDMFKYLHKKLSRKFYGCDLDFILVDKYPYRIIAFLDYKKHREPITFSETIAYNVLMQLAPVYIIRSQDVENGPFYIQKFNGGNPKPDPPVCSLIDICKCGDWQELERWELQLRQG